MATHRKERKEDEAYSYLPVTCPGCGREGKVNISRLDHTFTCMQCRRAFHISLQGSVLGERTEQVVLDPYALPQPERSSRLIRTLEQLPRAAWWAAGGVAAATIAIAFAWFQFFGHSAPLPESLDDRARFVAEAVARAEYRKLKAIVPSGAYYAAADWARSARPADWPREIPPESDVEVQLEIVFKSSGGEQADPDAAGSAGILVTVKTPAAKSSPEWMLYWIQDSRLQWMFDAKRTAKGG